MPLYEYQCQSCGHRSEEMQRISDPPLTVCPACGGEYKKLISAPAFQFKGSGWYVTDYARKGDTGKESKGGKAAADSGAAKSEAAPAAESKAESKPGGDKAPSS